MAWIQCLIKAMWENLSGESLNMDSPRRSKLTIGVFFYVQSNRLYFMRICATFFVFWGLQAISLRSGHYYNSHSLLKIPPLSHILFQRN